MCRTQSVNFAKRKLVKCFEGYWMDLILNTSDWPLLSSHSCYWLLNAAKTCVKHKLFAFVIRNQSVHTKKSSRLWASTELSNLLSYYWYCKKNSTPNQFLKIHQIYTNHTNYLFCIQNSEFCWKWQVCIPDLSKVEFFTSHSS